VTRLAEGLEQARAHVEAERPALDATRQQHDEIRCRLDQLPEVDATLLGQAEDAVHQWKVAWRIVDERRADLVECERQLDAIGPLEPLPGPIAAVDPDALLRAIERERGAAANL